MLCSEAAPSRAVTPWCFLQKYVENPVFWPVWIKKKAEREQMKIKFVYLFLKKIKQQSLNCVLSLGK